MGGSVLLAATVAAEAASPVALPALAWPTVGGVVVATALFRLGPLCCRGGQTVDRDRAADRAELAVRRALIRADVIEVEDRVGLTSPRGFVECGTSRVVPQSPSSL